MNTHPQVVRAIMFNQEGELLMMERHKDGKHYFSLIGGHVERLSADKEETPGEALIREVFEETSLVVHVERLLYAGLDSYNTYQHIYLCQYVSGKLALSPASPEKRIDLVSGQTHHPRWCTIDALQDQVIYPRWLLQQLQHDMGQNFATCPREIDDKKPTPTRVG